MPVDAPEMPVFAIEQKNVVTMDTFFDWPASLKVSHVASVDTTTTPVAGSIQGEYSIGTDGDGTKHVKCDVERSSVRLESRGDTEPVDSENVSGLFPWK